MSGDGQGGKEIQLQGVSGEAACLAACIEKHPEANGITMDRGRTKCYCEFNQDRVSASSTWDNRYISCGKHLWLTYSVTNIQTICEYSNEY